jgi:hypothetical protein
MKFVSAESAAVGTDWTAFEDLQTRGVDLLNATGTDLEFRRAGDPSAVMQLPDGLGFNFRVVANLSELEFRRVDVSNTQVTIYGDAE